MRDHTTRRGLLAALMAAPALPLARRADAETEPLTFSPDALISSEEMPGGSLKVEFEVSGREAAALRRWLDDNSQSIDDDDDDAPTPQAVGRDELAAAALAMGSMVDEARRLTAEYAVVTDYHYGRPVSPEKRAAIDAFEAGVWAPACERFDAIEERLMEVMRSHDMTAVVVGGRLYIDGLRSAEADTGGTAGSAERIAFVSDPKSSSPSRCR